MTSKKLDIKRRIVIAILNDFINHDNRLEMLPHLMEIRSNTKEGKVLLEDYIKQIVVLLTKEELENDK